MVAVKNESMRLIVCRVGPSREIVSFVLLRFKNVTMSSLMCSRTALLIGYTQYHTVPLLAQFEGVYMRLEHA